MSEQEFLEELFNDDDEVPTDPDQLLEFATYMYDLYLSSPPDSPLRTSNEINWEEFRAIIEQAKAADDEVKRLEQEVNEAEASAREVEAQIKELIGKMLPEN